MVHFNTAENKNPVTTLLHSCQSKWSKGSAESTSENKNSKKESLLAVLAVTS